MADRRFPVPPVVTARVVQVAADPECSVADLAKIISGAPVFSAEVLRAVNSAYYGLNQKIASVDRAVGYMGIRAVRNLVLCLGIRELAPKQSVYPLEAFWEASLRRAVAARSLAERTGLAAPDELFTLGLCQDLGLLVLVGDDDTLAEELARVAGERSDARLAAERAAGPGHDEHGAELFASWEFPDDLVVPVRHHHAPEGAPVGFVAPSRIAYAAEAVADLLETDGAGAEAGLAEARARLQALGLAEDDLGPLVDELRERVGEAASMLELTVGPQPSMAEIAALASHGLARLNQDYEQTLSEQREQAERLEKENQELAARATIDELTGLPNRRAFDDTLEREMARSARHGEPLTLAMLDIDHFKRFNDTYGHQVGDEVLKVVASSIRSVLRVSDMPARYGGEEFAVVLPSTPLDGAQIVAERIRAAIEQSSLQHQGARLTVTASIGVALAAEAGHPRAGINLVRAADDALYSAKESGRNRVQVA